MHLAVAALLLAASSARGTVMRIGGLPRTPAGARVVGLLAPATLLHITVALKPRDPAALQSYVRAVSSPGSLYYHAYLTPAQFARRFGASSAEVRVVRDDLLAHGLRPGPLSARETVRGKPQTPRSRIRVSIVMGDHPPDACA